MKEEIQIMEDNKNIPHAMICLSNCRKKNPKTHVKHENKKLFCM